MIHRVQKWNVGKSFTVRRIWVWALQIVHSSLCNIRHCNIYSLQPDTIHCTRHLQKTSTPALKASVLFFFIIELLSVPYELPYDEPLESQPTWRKYFLRLLTHRIRHRQYVEYQRQLSYCGWRFVRLLPY